jgi:hypothetical protein
MGWGASASNSRRVALNLRLGSSPDIVEEAAVLLEPIIDRKVFRPFLGAERTPERFCPPTLALHRVRNGGLSQALAVVAD